MFLFFRQPGSIKVRLGEWDRARPVENYPADEVNVSQIRFHPSFNQSIPLNMSNLQNSIALLRLTRPVTMSNPAINSICLPASTTVFDGQRWAQELLTCKLDLHFILSNRRLYPQNFYSLYRCIISGWGKDTFNGTYQIIAREAEVPVISNTDCQNKLRLTRLGPFFVLDPVSFMCAGGEYGLDACTVSSIQ